MDETLTWSDNLSKESEMMVIINYDITNAIEGKIM